MSPDLNAIRNQPDGIEDDSRDLPDPDRAAERIREYVSEFGDGLYDVTGGKPLYARDLEAVVRALAAVEQDRDRLRERLAAAETVCTIYGWTGGGEDSERGKATTQAWMDWHHAYGSPKPSPEWDAQIAELAARRDAIRAKTLAAIRGGEPGATEASCGCSFERWGRDSFKVGVCAEHSGEAGQ